MRSTIILVIVIVALVVALGLVAYFGFRTDAGQDEELIIGGDQDEHGCMLMAGYSWCEAEQKCLRPWEQGCEDQVFASLNNIVTKTGIAFSKPTSTEFQYQVEGNEGVELLTITGYAIAVDDITNQTFEGIAIALKSDGFEDSKYNGAGSFVGSRAGYEKSNFSLVCLVNNVWSEFSEDDPMVIPESGDDFNKNVTVQCGILEKSRVPEISVERQITKVLAEKYNKKLAQTTVQIIEQTEGHAKGNVEFIPGGSENSGMFLAVKVTGEWQVVFDGNGSIACADLAQYNFPAEMTANVCY